MIYEKAQMKQVYGGLSKRIKTAEKAKHKLADKGLLFIHMPILLICDVFGVQHR